MCHEAWERGSACAGWLAGMSSLGRTRLAGAVHVWKSLKNKKRREGGGVGGGRLKGVLGSREAAGLNTID